MAEKDTVYPPGQKIDFPNGSGDRAGGHRQ